MVAKVGHIPLGVGPISGPSAGCDARVFSWRIKSLRHLCDKMSDHRTRHMGQKPAPLQAEQAQI